MTKSFTNLLEFPWNPEKSQWKKYLTEMYTNYNKNARNRVSIPIYGPELVFSKFISNCFFGASNRKEHLNARVASRSLLATRWMSEYSRILPLQACL